MKKFKILKLLILVTLIVSCSKETLIQSNDNFIEKFTIVIGNDTFNGVINETTITVDIPEIIDLTNLAPEIIISQKASINPPLNSTIDFSNPVTYTVTSESGIEKKYIVQANKINSTLTINSGDSNIPPRLGHESIFFNNYYWIMGGDTPFGKTNNDIWRSPDGISYEKVVNHAPWACRKEFNLLIFNDQLWVIGGYSNRDEAGNEYTSDELVKKAWRNDIWKSIDGINWTKVLENGPWQTRISFSAGSFNGKLYVIGGHSTTNWHLYQDIWESPDGFNWTKIGEISDEILGNEATRQGICANDLIEFNGKFYLIGGQRASAYNDFDWILESTNGKDWIVTTKLTPWKGQGYSNAKGSLDFMRPFVFNNKLCVTLAHWTDNPNSYDGKDLDYKLFTTSNGVDFDEPIILPRFNNFILKKPRVAVNNNNKVVISGSYWSFIKSNRDDELHFITLDL